MDRLTVNKRKLFARENPTIMSMNKDELGGHYNQIFDRLQAYENTGLTPEEIEELKKRYFEVVVERDKLKAGKTTSIPVMETVTYDPDAYLRKFLK